MVVDALTDDEAWAVELAVHHVLDLNAINDLADEVEIEPEELHELLTSALEKLQGRKG